MLFARKQGSVRNNKSVSEIVRNQFVLRGGNRRKTSSGNESPREKRSFFREAPKVRYVVYGASPKSEPPVYPHLSPHTAISQTLFLQSLPKPVTGITFEGTRRTKKGISAKYAALLTGARQGGTTKSALKRPLAGNILQQAPAFARTTRQPCVARASTLPARV